MKNKSFIDTDGINIYIHSYIKSKLIGKLVVGGMILTFFTAYIWFVTTADFDGIGKAVIPLILIPCLVLFFGGRFLLWNIYGHEAIIVNSKSVSYSYDYGIIQTNLKTITYDKLGIEYVPTRNIEDEQFGRLSFINYRTEDNLPEVIHETGIEISTEFAHDIADNLRQVLYSEFTEDNDFIPFSEN